MSSCPCWSSIIFCISSLCLATLRGGTLPLPLPSALSSLGAPWRRSGVWQAAMVSAAASVSALQAEADSL